jgi:transposase
VRAQVSVAGRPGRRRAPQTDSEGLDRRRHRTDTSGATLPPGNNGIHFIAVDISSPTAVTVFPVEI